MLPRPLKLRTRIAGAFILTFSAWSVLTIVGFGYLLSDSSRHFYREQEGVHLARTLVAEAAPLVYYEDLAGLASLFDRQTKTIPYTRYLVVLNGMNRPIWSTFPNGVPKNLLNVPHHPIEGKDVSIQSIRSDGERLYDYEARKGDVRIRMGLTAAPLHAMIRRVIRYASLLGAAGLAAVLILAFSISRPLETLSAALERAVRLDRKTGGPGIGSDTMETLRIEQHFHTLMDRLEERTRQLDSAKKLAYLGEISASIAHEVNNPLGVVALNAGFLSNRVKAGEFNSQAAEEVKRLQTASKRATLATQKLLQFARHTTQNGAMRPHPVRCAPLVNECIELLEERLRQTRCTLRAELPPDLPDIVCDEQGIQQVIFNLLTNAIDSSPDGSEITLTLALDGRTLVLRVSDRGHGMSEDALQRAVEPFYTTKKDGTGLGLAISHAIIQAHGGRLTFDSREGTGTTATVRIPVMPQS